MSDILLDARGRACPEPVLMVKQALKDNSSTVEVLVDNNTAVQNITRFAASKKYSVEVTAQDSEFKLAIKKEA